MSPHRARDCIKHGPTERREGSRLRAVGSMAVDQDYLIRRMAEERQRAAEADNDAVRAAHEELAERYAAEIERLKGADGPELGLVAH